ncbi:MAG TPA: serine--tRNA ligase, partial [Acidobacteriota bacterium]|nr:serine--tRNA ligase [Acidobacteriota bacterium]
MLDANFVRENRDVVERKLKSRGVTVDLSEFYSRDEQRRSAIREVETLKHRSNVVSKEIGEAQRRGEDVESRKEEMRKAKEQIKQLD